mgnify:CR=1 FL=1
MIELARHIEVLLLSNDCVIVPDLGGFVAHHVEARYDDTEHLFLPPQRTLGFNSQLRLNDSLLVQSYIEVYDISYPEAVRRIEAEVNELRQHLASESFYELNGIGTLSLNEEGKLEFAPCEAGILTPELYALSTFDMLPLKTEAPALADDNVGAGNHEAIVIRKSWLRNAVAVAAAVVCFFLYTTPISNSTPGSNISLGSIELPINTKYETVRETSAPVQKQTEASLQTGEPQQTVADLQTTVTVDSSLTAAGTTTVTTAQAKAGSGVEPSAKAATENTNSSTASQAAVPATYFSIVLASDVAEGNANDFVKRLKKDGFDEARVYVHNHLRRVIYGTYASETEAYNELRKLRSSKFFEEAWVYKVKE